MEPSDSQHLDASRVTSRRADLVRQLIIAAVVGCAAGLLLLVFEGMVHVIEHLVWDRLPESLGVATNSRWWMFVVLAAGGLLVGLVLQFAPGHGGHDPATEGLMGDPMPITWAPGLVAAALLTLAFGVSLGPEAPLLGTLSAVLGWLALRRGLDPQGLVAVGMAGMLGAMFGAPVGAAFAFVELVPQAGRALYDRLVPLFVASTAGALTVVFIAARPQFVADFGTARAFIAVDLVSAALIGVLGAGVGLVVGSLLGVLHPVAQRLPLVGRLTIGGVALGGLAALGGELVLFSGQRELAELVTDSGLSGGGVALVVVAKVLSLVVALAVGFRGGKIFPAVFIGAGLGVIVHALIPGVPLVLACGAAMVGMVLAFTRLWMLTLLLTTMIAGVEVLPLLGVALVAAYLVVADRPEVRVQAGQPAGLGY